MPNARLSADRLKPADHEMPVLLEIVVTLTPQGLNRKSRRSSPAHTRLQLAGPKVFR
jgi:hypothetical protein